MEGETHAGDRMKWRSVCVVSQRGQPGPMSHRVGETKSDAAAWGVQQRLTERSSGCRLSGGRHSSARSGAGRGRSVDPHKAAKKGRGGVGPVPQTGGVSGLTAETPHSSFSSSAPRRHTCTRDVQVQDQFRCGTGEVCMTGLLSSSLPSLSPHEI